MKYEHPTPKTWINGSYTIKQRKETFIIYYNKISIGWCYSLERAKEFIENESK